MDTGSIVVTGLDANTIVNAVRLQMSHDIRSKPIAVPADYRIDDTSERVVKLILGTAGLSNLWSGVIDNDLI